MIGHTPNENKTSAVVSKKYMQHFLEVYQGLKINFRSWRKYVWVIFSALKSFEYGIFKAVGGYINRKWTCYFGKRLNPAGLNDKKKSSNDLYAAAHSTQLDCNQSNWAN